MLLGRDASWQPWLTPLIAVTGALAVLGLLAAPVLGRLRGRVLAVAIALGILSSVSGPLAYAAYTVSTPHSGSIVSAGPATSGEAGMPGSGGLRGGGAFGGGARPAAAPGGAAGSAGGSAPSGAPNASQRQLFSGSSSPAGGGTVGSTGASVRSGSSPGGPEARAQFSGGGQPGGGASSVSSQLVKALRSNASDYRWSAATSGSQSAASLELASGTAVMGIGGFNNEGGNLSLAAFERYVAKGDIHYYVASSGAGGGGIGGGGPGGGGTSSSIATWVKASFKTVKLGSTTVYDLTQRS